MFLEIVTPDQKVFEGEVLSASFPGTKGSFQVLENHAPIISSLEKGVIKVNTSKEESSFEVEGGVVEVSENKIAVLATSLVA